MKHPIILKTILITMLSFVSPVVWAHKGSFRGMVSDAATHKPIEGASLYIKSTNQGTSSDAFGKIFLKDIEPGKCIVTLSSLGYETTEQELIIEDGVTTDVAFTLKRSSVVINEVAVSAKKEMGAVSGTGLKLIPVNTTQDMLRLVPGLFTAQHQGGGKAEQIFLRGFDCDHGTDVNVSLDNMPVNMVSHAHGQGFADAHFIIPESVREVEYGKGPYQVDKGNLCTAGYVGFKTRNTLDDNFVKVEGGSYDYFRTAAGINLLGKNVSASDAYIIGEYAYNRGYFDQSQNFNRVNVFGKYTTRISSDKIFTLALSGFRSSWDASGQVPERAVATGLVSRYGDLDPEAGKTSRYNANLQYFQSINAGTYFKTNLYFTYYTFRLFSDLTYFTIDSVNGDQLRQAEKRFVSGYNNEYTTRYHLAGLNMKTQAGFGLRYDNIMNDELSHTASQRITLNPIALGDVHETNLFGYAGQSVDLLPGLKLNTGIRYDFFIQQYINKLADAGSGGTFSSGRFSPKAGITYDVSPNTRFYYSYGTGFHTNDTRTLALGRQLGSEVIISNTIPLAFSHDLGVITRPTKQFQLSCAVWLINMQQEFGYSGDEAILDTSGRTRRYGVDAALHYEPFKWLSFDVDANYAHGRFVDAAAGHDYIPLASSFTSVGSITFKYNNSISASLRYRHMNDRPANNDNTLKASGYTVLDAVVNYNVRRCEFGLQVQNLLNTQWNEAQFATETRLRYPNGTLEPTSKTDVCFTPGIPLFLKLSAAWKF